MSAMRMVFVVVLLYVSIFVADVRPVRSEDGGRSSVSPEDVRAMLDEGRPASDLEKVMVDGAGGALSRGDAGNWLELFRKYEDGLDGTPSADFLLTETRLLIAAGRLDAAYDTVDRLSSAYPDAWQALYASSLYHSAVGERVRALEELMMVVNGASTAPPPPSVFASILYDAARSLYDEGRREEALDLLGRSLHLEWTRSKAWLYERWRRESVVEEDYSSSSTSIVHVSFEDTPEQREYKEKVIELMEEAYDTLSRALARTLDSPVEVVIYPDRRAYAYVSFAPHWSAALYNGKIRIPIAALEGDEAEFSRILRHELFHLFVDRLWKRRIPAWLNEGMAQYLEGDPERKLAEARVRLNRMFRGRKARRSLRRVFLLERLRGSFAALTSTSMVRIAYMISFLAVYWLVEEYGMERLVDLLEDSSETPEDDFEEVMDVRLDMNYEELDEAFYDWLYEQVLGWR